jgi:hypothetical protein
MEKKLTAAARVRRAFKSGRPRVKDRLLSTTAGIYEACQLLDGLRNAMEKAELSKHDVQAAVVLMTPETPGKENAIYVLPIPEPGELPKLFQNIAAVEAPEKVLTLGIAIKQRDHEAKSLEDKAVAWVHPFLTGPRAESALKSARTWFAAGKEGRTTFN